MTTTSGDAGFRGTSLPAGRPAIWDTIRFPCHNSYPAIDPDTGVEVCYDCEAHRDDCACPDCEVSRALDDDADMATSPDRRF